jgi:dsDNA-binding SOS-regulon protein|tara:strand:- start:6 stop:230 length:225 start_codon:yes stop_codon:yes gene_type:complete
MKFIEILNELEQIKRDIYKLGFTDNKENENYDEALDLVDRLQETHNAIYDHNMKQDRLIKNLVDWLKEEREFER